MKNLKYVFGILTLILVANFAASDPAPFNFETNRRFLKDEVRKTMLFKLNSASVFPSGDTLSMVDQFGNPAVLPAGADVLHTYFYVKTSFAAANDAAANLGITCGSATLLSSTNEKAATANVGFAGHQTVSEEVGADSLGLVGASQCTITATQSVGVFTAGKLYGWTEYTTTLP